MDSPRILWISGPPAAGKSVLAVSIVDKIRKTHGEGSCQYHNLSFADKTKRSASYLLRSLAYQIGQSKPLFRRKLLQLAGGFRVPLRSMNAGILWDKVFPGLLFQMMPEKPLYWVIDGLDESDSVSKIFECLSKTESDSLTVKILLVSRPTADIKMRVKSLPLKCSIQNILPSDTEDDIRAYVSDRVINTIPGKEALHRRIINEIMDKASGNFLWVALVLKALEQNWDTKRDIDRVIREFPSGMTTTYGSMMQKLDSSSRRDLASLILTWATFSSRPLSITELATALEPKYEDLTSLEDTVRHVCGGFVQVRHARVGLIHETAQHFLINETKENSIRMVPVDGHERLAIACLHLLRSNNQRPWRLLLKQVEDSCKSPLARTNDLAAILNDRHPLLTYASESWAYHLSLARTNSHLLLQTVYDFLKHDCLTWINTSALSGDLKNLIKSAQHLKKFVRRKMKTLAEANSAKLRSDDAEDLNLWAVDLIRLVGKFGSNIVLSPSSIYRLVPPFCPDNSMIRKFFGKANQSFSVTGISNPDWDDLHARLSVDPDDSASKLVATGDMFAALVPQAHCIVIWDAETCEEVRRIQHDEYLTEMAASKKGDLICTSGANTVTFWDVATGRQLACNPKTSSTQIIALAFDAFHDDILVGYQDYLITCHKWRTHERVFAFRATEAGESVPYGGAFVMKFSPDGTQVAFGSKSKPVEIWDLRSRTLLYRYRVALDSARAHGERLLPPETIQWHPSQGRVYILYHEGRLVDWNPVYEEQTEHQIGAKEMLCSPCGSYLLTSDNRGAIRVFSLPSYASDEDRRFRLIYHLECGELVRDLAFHPNGQRFYDIRGTICNVWEPEALVQADDADTEEERSSTEGAPEASEAAEAFQDDASQITALVCGPSDFAFCCGRDDGTLSIHEMNRGSLLRSLPGHAENTAIIALVWSETGKWIASADDSGHVLVRQVQIPTRKNPKWLVWKASDFRVEGSIVQLLISPNDKHLLVACTSFDKVWDIPERFISQTRKPRSQKPGRWLQHPTDSSRLILVCAQEVHICEWAEFRALTGLPGLPLKRQISDSQQVQLTGQFEQLDLGSTLGADSLEVVNYVISSRDRQSIIFETFPNSGHGHDRLKGRRIELIRTAALETTDRIEVQDNISGLRSAVAKLVGTYQNQVIFFNHQYWLCSWNIEANASAYKKHLFLPKDWLNAETLHLTIFSANGTLLCPKNGEVAIIKAGIQF